jgi:Glucodextranase, domain B
MSQNTPTIHRILLSIAVLSLVGYSLFNSRFLIKGPEIAIAGVNPITNSIQTNTKDFSLKGTALHSSFITVNNRPIFVDESGNFDEKLLLSNGVSIIDIYAKDKFGKEVRKKIDVVYTGESPTLTDEYNNIALRAQQSSSSKEVVKKEFDDEEVSTMSIDASVSTSSTATTSSPTSVILVE